MMKMILLLITLWTIGAQSISVIHIPPGRSAELLKAYTEFKNAEARFEALRFAAIHYATSPNAPMNLKGTETTEDFRNVTKGLEFSNDFTVLILPSYQNHGYVPGSPTRMLFKETKR